MIWTANDRQWFDIIVDYPHALLDCGAAVLGWGTVNVPYVAPPDLFDHFSNLAGFSCDSNKPVRWKRNVVVQHIQTQQLCRSNVHQSAKMWGLNLSETDSRWTYYFITFCLLAGSAVCTDPDRRRGQLLMTESWIDCPPSSVYLYGI